jgi:hypothetical protein
MMDAKEAFDFVERWLARAHLYRWLIGDVAISVMVAWWAHNRGWDLVVVMLAAIGAFAVILGAGAALVLFLRRLIARRRRSPRVGVTKQTIGQLEIPGFERALRGDWVECCQLRRGPARASLRSAVRGGPA